MRCQVRSNEILDQVRTIEIKLDQARSGEIKVGSNKFTCILCWLRMLFAVYKVRSIDVKWAQSSSKSNQVRSHV